MPLRVKVANTNTGPVVINTNGLGNVAAKNPDGTAMHTGQLRAGSVYSFAHDGTNWELQSLPADFQSLLVNASSILSSNTTLGATANRTIIVAQASAGAFTITLPPAASSANFLLYVFRNDANLVAVTIDGNGSQINAVNSLLLRSQSESVLLYCDGANWQTLSHNNKQLQVVTLTSGASWNVPADVRTLHRVVAVGGGGGGGGANTNSAGAGGGAGGKVVKYNYATSGGTISYAIGGGGAGGSAAPTNGSAGGTTTFGSLSATGGYFGYSSGNGSPGRGRHRVRRRPERERNARRRRVPDGGHHQGGNGGSTEFGPGRHGCRAG